MNAKRLIGSKNHLYVRKLRKPQEITHSELPRLEEINLKTDTNPNKIFQEL
jgi:hypothetical protein